MTEEIAELQPWSYPTRRLQGVYYREQLDRFVASGRVTLTEWVGTVVELASAGADIAADQTQKAVS